jgi:hypothetical protein
MKKYFKYCLFLWNILLVAPGCSGQRINTVEFAKPLIISLDEYKVDSCLNNILLSVVEADSAQFRFPSHLYYYQLEFTTMENQRTMILTPSRWQRYLPKDCVGVIQLNGMKFLCIGNFINDSLFQKVGKRISIEKQIVSEPKYDSLDKDIKWFDWEKSPTAIVGKFVLCTGPPIDLYINVGKKF